MRIGHWVAVIAVLASLLGCEGPAREHDSGNIEVAVQAVTPHGSITRIAIALAPANVTQDLTYDPTRGTFTGTLVIPAGEQTLTATAYSGATVVGTGSATVTVVTNQTASIQLFILDTTGAPDVPDHMPFITSFVVPKTSLAIGDEVELAATAVDVDGDPLTYAWTETCTTGVTGTFSAPTAATTRWSANAQGTCTLKLTVTAKTLTDSKQVEMMVLDPGSGAVNVTGAYVRQPVIESLMLADGVACRSSGVYPCFDSAPSSTITAPIFPTERARLVTRVANVGPDGELPTLTISDDCGGTYSPVSNGSSGGSSVFEGVWTAPATPAVCTLMASTHLLGLSDSFPVAVLVSGCVDDLFEHNDTLAEAAGTNWYVYEWQPISVQGLYAHDTDWYAFSVSAAAGTSALSVTLSTADAIVADLYAADKTTVLASGSGTLTSALTPSGGFPVYYLRVRPGAMAADCNSSYGLSITVE